VLLHEQSKSERERASEEQGEQDEVALYLTGNLAKRAFLGEKLSFDQVPQR
jgi:hypothetical protein